MRRVSHFEADLLTILHAILGRAPVEEAVVKVVRRSPRPNCLGRDAVELVQETLARGCAHRLARLGGWRDVSHPRGEAVASGRLWERTSPADLGLSFSRHTLGFLIWLTAEHPGDRLAPWNAPSDELADGDRILLFFAYDAFRATSVAKDLLAIGHLATMGLCHLAFPDDFAEHEVAGEPEMRPWVSGVGACVLEALQPRLATRWEEVERHKGRIGHVAKMRRLGDAQARALDAFLVAADADGRRDLARFLLVAASALLRDEPKARAWVGGLDLKGRRLADRTDTYRAARAMLDRLTHLRSWDAEARATGYFDEGYAAAQLWKSDWERLGGDAVQARAGAIVRDLESLPI